MSVAHILDLHFLGQRSYLQGTTLFDCLSEQCRTGRRISFRIGRQMFTDRVALESFVPGDATAGRFAATLTWSEAGTHRGIGVLPVDPSPSPRREPFDEDTLLATAVFEGDTASLRTPGQVSLVQLAVALNKALLLRLLKPAGAGQWLFVRLDIDRVVERFEALRVTRRASAGVAAVSSLIDVDGHRLGTLIFSWLKK